MNQSAVVDPCAAGLLEAQRARYLCARMLEVAVSDLLRLSRLSSRVDKASSSPDERITLVDGEQASRWLFDDVAARDARLSIITVCDVLGGDFEQFRRVVRTDPVAAQRTINHLAKCLREQVSIPDEVHFCASMTP